MPTPIFRCLPSSTKPQESDHTVPGHGPDSAESAGVPVSCWPDETGSIFRDGTTNRVSGFTEIDYGENAMLMMVCTAGISSSTPKNMSSSSEGLKQPHDPREEQSAEHAQYTYLPPPNNSRMYFVPLNGTPAKMREDIHEALSGKHPILAVGLCEGALCPGFIFFKLPHDRGTPFENLYAIGALKQVGTIHGPKELTSLEKTSRSKFNSVPKNLVAKLEAELVAVRLRLGKAEKLSRHTLDIYIYVDQLPTILLQLYFSESPPNELELVLPTTYSFPFFASSIVEIVIFIDRVMVSDNTFEYPLCPMLISKQFISIHGVQIELAMNLKPRLTVDDADVHESLRHICSILKAFEKSLIDTHKLNSSITSPLQSANILLSTAASNIKANSTNAGSDPDRTSGTEPEGQALDQEQSDPSIAIVTTLSESLLALGRDLISFCTSYESVWKPVVIRSAAEVIAHGALLIEQKGHLSTSSILISIGNYLRSVDAARMLFSHIGQVRISGGLVAEQRSTNPAYTLSSLVIICYDEPLASLSERVFDLGPSVTIQRIRLINCDELVQNRRLQVLEVLDHHDLSQIQYSAVSYVWRGIFDGKILPASYSAPPGAFAVQGVERDGDPIKIDVLISAARASLKGGFRYMWLDRLCISQDNRQDKRWQLEKMLFLYRHCKRCIIIPNGLLSLISPEKSSPWLTRMWTLEEGLIPKDPQVVFSWTHGPGILVEDQHADEEKAIGYIDEIEPGVGLIPLLFLTRQKFGTKLSFRDYAGNPKTDVVFNLLGDGRLDDVSCGDGGLATFADTADSFRPQGDIALIRREERYGQIWRSALARDATNRDDTVLIVSGLLSLQRQDDPSLLGKRRYTLDESQMKPLVTIVKSFYTRDSYFGRDERAEWATKRLKYDLWYGFEMHTKCSRIPFFSLPHERAYSPPPSHLCIKIPGPSNSDALHHTPSTLSSLLPGAALEILDSLLTTSLDAYASIRALSLHGRPPETTGAHSSCSIATLQSILRRLPRLSDVELRSWTPDSTMMADLSLKRPIILQHLKLVDVQPVQSHHEPLAFLLSLFDTEVLCIDGPPFVKPASSLTTEAEFSNLRNNLIHNVRRIHMHCDTDVMVLWLCALGNLPCHNTTGDAPAGDANRPSTLHTVDIVCSDMPAAYVLGDFLRTEVARSVEHLIIDMSQSCIIDQPINPEDIGRAILHHQPRSFHTLTIRLHLLIDASMRDELADDPCTFLTSYHMGRRVRSALESVYPMLETLNLEIDLVPLDPTDNTQFTVTSILHSIASRWPAAVPVAVYAVNGWTRRFSSLKHVNIVWRRPTHKHEGCTIDANDLVTGFVLAVRKYHSKPKSMVPLTEEQLSEADSLVRSLVESGFMTSRWDTYEREEEEDIDARPLVGGWTTIDPANWHAEHENDSDVDAQGSGRS